MVAEGQIVPLARLGSAEYVEKVCANATAQCYQDPLELWDCPLGQARGMLKSGRPFNRKETQAHQRFVAAIEAEVDHIEWGYTPWDEIVHSDTWERMRNAALECLKECGYPQIGPIENDFKWLRNEVHRKNRDLDLDR